MALLQRAREHQEGSESGEEGAGRQPSIARYRLAPDGQLVVVAQAKFKDEDHHLEVLTKFGSFKPKALKAAVWLDLYDGCELADKLQIIEESTWLSPPQVEFVANYVNTRGVQRQLAFQLHELRAAEVISAKDLTVGLATLKMFVYLNNNANRFSKMIIPLVNKQILFLEKLWQKNESGGGNFYGVIEQLMNAEMVEPLSKRIKDALKTEIKNAEETGLNQPILEFAENLGFFYGALPPDTTWPGLLRGYLQDGFKAMEKAAISLDKKGQEKFARHLVFGGCYPGRVRMAEEGLKSPKTVQDTVNAQVNKGGDDKTNAMIGMMKFFINEVLGCEPEKVTKATYPKVSWDKFKVYVQNTCKAGLMVKKKAFSMSDSELESLNDMLCLYPDPDYLK